MQKQYPPLDEATTVCTTQSPLTRNTQTQSTISVLEETIHKQQQEIQNMLRRFNAMDTKMDHLTTAIKTGEMNQNNTIIHIQQQLDTVCDSLKFMVQQSTGSQANQYTQRQTRLSTRDPSELQCQSERSHEHFGNDTMTDGGVADDKPVDTTPPRSRSPMGNSPEKKKQRSAAPTTNQSDSQMELHQLNPLNTTQPPDDKNIQGTDQSGAQYTSPSPSDGGGHTE